MLDKIIEQQEAIIRELQSAGYSIINNKERAQHELALRHAIVAYCELLDTQHQTHRYSFGPLPDVSVKVKGISPEEFSQQIKEVARRAVDDI